MKIKMQDQDEDVDEDQYIYTKYIECLTKQSRTTVYKLIDNYIIISIIINVNLN